MNWGRGAAARALLLACCLAVCRAGPLGTADLGSNATLTDFGAEDGSCVAGGVRYVGGAVVPGSGPCEICRCEAGRVACTTQRCDPRPGCKALHRPDQCCPLYQCECEQEGRVYGNGEKLSDPLDPCRVCYCQGGEVVCRRIACFLRDDCRPRLVPGRCCPEYDNCPIRGVTALTGVAASISSMSAVEDASTSPVPPTPRPNVMPEITIKEITPVSEIPVITEVKIKEILPSPTMEVIDYSSSKSPLFPREATEKSVIREIDTKTEAPMIIEGTSTLSVSISELPPEAVSKFIPSIDGSMPQSLPSKIPTQDSNKIETPIHTIVSTVQTGSSDFTPTFKTTKSPIIEEEDTSIFDHNPAFPPLPDDLSVNGNHDDEIIDQNMDGIQDDIVNVVSSKESVTTLRPELISSEKAVVVSSESSIINLEKTTESSHMKQSPMLNLRSAIPTEILNLASSVPEDITGEFDETTPGINNERVLSLPKTNTNSLVENFDRSNKTVNITGMSESSNSTLLEHIVPTVGPIFKTNAATEATTQTELSSLPIETSDQKPHEIIDSDKMGIISFTALPVTTEVTSTKNDEVSSSASSYRAVDIIIDNLDTTEMASIANGSIETSTDVIELLKPSSDSKKNAAIIEPVNNRKNSVLTDLINIVSDVASISDGTAESHTENTSTDISESEELISVNAGYKSKNKNWNLNSITEMPQKSKVLSSSGKQKIVEIEDDESQISDSPPPNDKIEPTTRRPIIDNVSDNLPENKTEEKDIEIITKSYVPTINRRPTKVVMKKSNDKPISDQSQTAGIPVSTLFEITTNFAPSVSTGMAGIDNSSSHTADSLHRVTSEATSTVTQ